MIPPPVNQQALVMGGITAPAQVELPIRKLSVTTSLLLVVTKAQLPLEGMISVASAGIVRGCKETKYESGTVGNPTIKKPSAAVQLAFEKVPLALTTTTS